MLGGEQILRERHVGVRLQIDMEELGYHVVVVAGTCLTSVVDCAGAEAASPDLVCVAPCAAAGCVDAAVERSPVAAVDC